MYTKGVKPEYIVVFTFALSLTLLTLFYLIALLTFIYVIS